MKTTFETKNIDEKFYNRFVSRYIMRSIPWSKKLKYWFTKRRLHIIFRPSTLASQDPFFDGVNGVGGVTSPREMVLYVQDKWENPLDNVQSVFRRNAKMISHELLHWLLMVADRRARVPLRNADYSGHKKGTILNFWTAEVHDRDIERNLFTLAFPYWDRTLNRKIDYQVSVLDGRDLF